MENLYTTNHIRTFTGIYINPLNAGVEHVNIEDIAHALAQIPRFGGHLPKPYNVASHCINCCYLADPPHKFEALMHDCTEAYLIDLPKPIKDQLPDYKEVEDKLYRIIAPKYGLKPQISDYVKNIDRKVLELEWDQLMLKNKAPLKQDQIWNWPFDEAKSIFLKLFEELRPQ